MLSKRMSATKVQAREARAEAFPIAGTWQLSIKG